jgi:hypothetical protein
MRVALASNGSLRIAQHRTAPVVNYEDSFAFVPGVSTGNMRVTAVVYRNPAYVPTDNHELEIILGCRTTSGGNHRWIECLWNAQGGVDIFSLDGQPSDFASIGAGTGLVSTGPQDGDVWVAELDRSSSTVKWWVNGLLACQATNSRVSDLGTGAGIAAFMRAGNTNPAAMGFRSFKCEAI